MCFVQSWAWNVEHAKFGPCFSLRVFFRSMKKSFLIVALPHVINLFYCWSVFRSLSYFYFFYLMLFFMMWVNANKRACSVSKYVGERVIKECEFIGNQHILDFNVVSFFGDAWTMHEDQVPHKMQGFVDCRWNHILWWHAHPRISTLSTPAYRCESTKAKLLALRGVSVVLRGVSGIDGVSVVLMGGQWYWGGSVVLRGCQW